MEGIKNKEKLSGAKEPVFIVVRGVPGSGKTLMSEKLLRLLSVDREAKVLDPDQINYKSDDYLEFSRALKAKKPHVHERFFPYRYLMKQAKDAVKSGVTIIWDQPFTSLDDLSLTLETLEETAGSNGLKLNVLIVEMEVTQDISVQRIQERVAGGGHGLTNEQIDGFFKKYTSAKELGYNTVTLNSGSRSAEDLAREVLLTIKTI